MHISLILLQCLLFTKYHANPDFLLFSVYYFFMNPRCSDVPGSLPLVGEMGPHDVILRAVVYSPDGSHLASATNSGSVTIWDANTYLKLHSLLGHTSMIKDLCYSPGGSHLASVAVEMCLRVWDVRDAYSLKTAWYGPTNKMAFLKDDVILLGEATGNKRCIEF